MTLPENMKNKTTSEKANIRFPHLWFPDCMQISHNRHTYTTERGRDGGLKAEWRKEREAMGDEYDESNDKIEINCLSEPS